MQPSSRVAILPRSVLSLVFSRLFFRRYAVLRSRIPVILLALLAVLMVGCGQKGPLYHPDDEQKSQQRDKDVFGL